jgi:hypothetical protein
MRGKCGGNRVFSMETGRKDQDKLALGNSLWTNHHLKVLDFGLLCYGRKYERKIAFWPSCWEFPCEMEQL